MSGNLAQRREINKQAFPREADSSTTPAARFPSSWQEEELFLFFFFFKKKLDGNFFFLRESEQKLSHFGGNACRDSVFTSNTI